ncbi:DNA recombination protein RmuC [Methylophilus medardicus]|uniref:DNA recombination protein RmuC n=2 Tax=Methylophilus medardicus TaxID=2588534 RepID=A0A5B8CVI3_9PROT|nr:DNA recombination protein RmuC [Methylophilus medardicus]QDC50335.1 DNA recombination protein RmuC [Methylophilus medardicus]QDC54040.1 DNA recombination protein RmuC [Methylophilus medardicus]
MLRCVDVSRTVIGYNAGMTLQLIQCFLLLIVIAMLVWQWRTQQHTAQQALAQLLSQQLEEKHRLMMSEMHQSLNQLADRLQHLNTDQQDRLRAQLSQELTATREAMQALQVAQRDHLSQSGEQLSLSLRQGLSEQGMLQQNLLKTALQTTTQTLTQSIESLTKVVDARLEEMSGKVSIRLEEGFKKTNETFVSVMERLATIDEAQKKIDGLSVNMVSLQELLGDKRSRGAYGEVQLEGLVRNVLPANSFAMQHTLSNGARVDCALFLPEPTGTVAVDSKFPLENYHRMIDSSLGEIVQAQASKLFKADIKKHVDDISNKYIIANETSDGAVMFIPAEAVFAEIHAYHGDIVDYAMQKRVWLVSPTTLMAVLNTARAVLKDVEMRKQVHIIKDELGKLSKDFDRFDTRMKKLADNIRQAHENAQDVHISSQKISRRFAQIEKVELAQTTSLEPLDMLEELDDIEKSSPT